MTSQTLPPPLRYGVRYSGAAPAKTKRARLIGTGAVELSANVLTVSGRITRPGLAALIALGLTVATLVIVLIVAQGTGFCCGPGFLVWYVICDYLTRKSVALTCAPGAGAAVYDPDRHRISIELPDNRWAPFKLTEANREAAFVDALKTWYGDRLIQGKLPRYSKAQKILLFVLLGLLGAIVLGAILAAVLSR